MIHWHWALYDLLFEINIIRTAARFAYKRSIRKTVAALKSIGVYTNSNGIFTLLNQRPKPALFGPCRMTIWYVNPDVFKEALNELIEEGIIIFDAQKNIHLKEG